MSDAPIVPLFPSATDQDEPEAVFRLLACVLQVADGFDIQLAKLAETEHRALARQAIALIRSVLDTVSKDLDRTFVDELDKGRNEFSFGVLDKLKSTKRAGWDEDLPYQVFFTILQPRLADGARDLARVLAAELPVRLEYRITELRAMGIDPSDWCTETPNGYSVKSTVDAGRLRTVLDDQAGHPYIRSADDIDEFDRVTVTPDV